GGRFAVSDIIYRGDLQEEVKQSMDLWTGCVAGALEESEFRRLLAEAGFKDIDIEPTRVYGYDDAVALLTESGLDAERLAKDVEGRVMSAFIKGEK
ncbi:MAG: arsenite methyltransferase, partial [Gemmatimonadales bacterium]